MRIKIDQEIFSDIYSKPEPYIISNYILIKSIIELMSAEQKECLSKAINTEFTRLETYKKNNEHWLAPIAEAKERCEEIIFNRPYECYV